jgi:hypothetical protein
MPLENRPDNGCDAIVYLLGREKTPGRGRENDPSRAGLEKVQDDRCRKLHETQSDESTNPQAFLKTYLL